MELELNLNIVGLEHPSGRLSYTISMAERTSLTRSSRFSPHLNSRDTRERLSLEDDVMVLSPSTELSEFSNSFVTLVSISLPLAPAYVVITEIYGGSISGNWSIGSFDKENKPMINTATKISSVVMGLSTADLYILIFQIINCLFLYIQFSAVN